MDVDRPAGFGRWIRLWFSTTQPVSRRDYVASGIGLGVAKFGVEWLAVRLLVGKDLPLEFYFTPLMSARMDALSPAPEWLVWAVAVWTLPFLWIALSMSVRRALDAGLLPWFGFLVVLPLFNFVIAILLSIAKARRSASARTQLRLARIRERHPTAERLPWPVAAVVLGSASGMAMVAFSTLILRSYGSVLFVAAPVVIGALVGFGSNALALRSAGSTLGATALAALLAAMGLLAVGIEGALCLVIIAPIVLVPALLGALLGRMIATSLAPEHWSPRGQKLHASLVVVLLPVLASIEAHRFPSATFEVTSAIEVDAPPEVVWRHVVSFSELPEPEGLLFRLGVAHPRRARIEGSGVGAVRHCEFSTGPFVEPITVWDEPRRLAFTVTAQPEPMHEWSPYHDLHPPHLDGYIRSVAGEFRLTPLPGGRTRLEGSTWYELDLFPQLYFRAWADSFIHSIHMQVLRHVARLSAAHPSRVR